ncbi:MAG: acyltransferase [Hyphomicrobiales bacterium]|nr:acyltransferase [Hyphomicrobiales bacterium]
MSPALPRRPDIDGLRALAIVPIVAFHAGLSQLRGGFVGVDIFFVISGFLITAIISRDMALGAFSLLAFYRRRVARIFPALFVMLAGVLALGCALLLPDDVRALAESAAAAAAFVSNIFFERSAGYFAPAAETIPLLHTWSLGVEEQFYLFYPPLLMAARRFFPQSLPRVVATFALVSFALSLYWAQVWPDGAFYLLPSRAWELALGGLVALGAFPPIGPRARQAAAALGLALLLLGLLVAQPGALFPAPLALMPCGGAALLIAYGETAKTRALLASRPLVAIGAISYSLYLWHWPAIVLARLVYDPQLRAPTALAAVGFALLAAVASWRFVERPLQARLREATPGPVVGAGATALCGMMALAWGVGRNADHWRTLPAPVRKVASYVDYRAWPQHRAQFVEGTCFVSLGETFDRAQCLRMDPHKRNMLVFGDSHAAQYWRAIADRFPAWNVMQATGSACRPMHGVSTESHCNDFVPFVLDHFLVDNRPDAVVLAGRWLEGETPALEQTARAIMARGAAVTIIGPGVEYEGEFPRLLAMAMLRGDVAALDGLRVADRAPLDREIAAMAARIGASYVSEQSIECPDNHCVLFDPDGGPFHYDYGHITLAGARLVAAAIKVP